MFIYLAIPILVIMGLCLFSFEAGRRLGKTKNPVIIKEPVKAPDHLLKEENERLAKLIEDKDRELAEQARLIETTLNENRKLLSKSRKEFMHKADDQRAEILNAIIFKHRISQLESELKKNNIEIPPLPVSYNTKSGK